MEKLDCLYSSVRAKYSQREIADYLNRDIRTIQRWEVKEDGPPDYAIHGLQNMLRGSEIIDTDQAEFRNSLDDVFSLVNGIATPKKHIWPILVWIMILLAISPKCPQ